MRKTAIVMDSTGYLTRDIVKQFDINIVPLNVTVGEETFPETEITNETFFEKLNKISGFSRTSQPSVGAFLEVYERLFANGAEEIISIHLSRALSGTLVSAQMARDLASNKNIHLFDSEAAALPLGLLAWAAAEWANAGMGAVAILDKLAKLKKETKLFFILETLENLHRGGRIGGAAALIGTLLQIKPILYFNERGEIDVFDKVRSQGRAWERVRRELDSALASDGSFRICVIHVSARELAENISRELREAYPQQDIRIFEAGPVIATHVGPGAFGLAFQPWPVN